MHRFLIVIENAGNNFSTYSPTYEDLSAARRYFFASGFQF